MLACLWVVSLLCASLVGCGADPGARAGRNVLVFGGTGFVGAPVVEDLLDAGHHVTVVSRGNWYWDFRQRVLPRVRWVRHDRLYPVDPAGELAALLGEDSSWDAIVDIPGDEHGPYELGETLAAVQGRVGLYVLVSHGMVYDVCERSLPAPLTEDRHAAKPEDEGERILLESHHKKADLKFRSEELLRNHSRDSGVPYVILRLPDVIGAGDNVHRFWLYQLWLRVAPRMKLPLLLPDFMADYNISFVYNKDVAAVVADIVTGDADVRNEVINLAYAEPMTVHSLVADMATALGLAKPLTETYDHNQTPGHFYYPTMQRGTLDVTKAVRLLSWKPTPWQSALNATVQFYEDAIRDDGHPTQRDEVIQVFVIQHLKHTRQAEFVAAVEDAYGISLPHFKPRDEL